MLNTMGKIWDPQILVVTPQRDLRHPMWQKMWERAGYDPSTVNVLPLEQWPQTGPGVRPVGPDIHTVITMGELGLNTVLQSQDLFRWRGRTQMVYTWGLPVVVLPTLRVTSLLPASAPDNGAVGSQLLNRPARFQGVWIRDVQYAVQNAGSFVRHKDNYLLDPKSPAQWSQWVRDVLANPAQLSFDIETQYTPRGKQSEEEDSDKAPEGALLRCSFSNAIHTASSIPWNAEFLPGIKALLTSSLPKLGWNCAAFDVPRLYSEGIEVGGVVRDFQDAWHVLESDLPKGLEWVSSFYTPLAPWKHLSDSNMARYAAIDADAALQNAVGIEKDLRAFDQWDLFERHTTTLMPILARAGRRGNLIDLGYQSILKTDMEGEKERLAISADSLVPMAVKPTKRVMSEPEPETPHVVVYVNAEVKQCSVCLAVIENKTTHLKGGKKNPCHGAIIAKIPGVKPAYDVYQPFNMGSSDQLQSYAKHFKHPMGKDPKTKQPTMNKAHLEKLRDKVGVDHPVYGMALEYSRVAKTLSTYMYLPDDLGLIHTTYVNAPSTWRLASRNYNLQNVGKRESNKWAKKARRQIISRPGYTFVQADSTSIEAVVVGHLIDDPVFMQVAKKSIHAYLVCQELGLAFTDETIKQVKDDYPDLYNQFKTAVYLLLYGGNPYLMHMTNTKLFPTLKSAQEIQDKIYRVLPKLQAWQERIREQAKRECVLQSPYGYRHKFFDVYTFKRDEQGTIQYDDENKPIIKLGADAKRALAFIPQNCAGGFARDNLVLIGQSKWADYMPPNVSVHDSYCLEVPDEMVDECAKFLVDILTRPVLELGNLQIGCEVEAGRNWAAWSPDNPLGMKTMMKVEA